MRLIDRRIINKVSYLQECFRRSQTRLKEEKSHHDFSWQLITQLNLDHLDEVVEIVENHILAFKTEKSQIQYLQYLSKHSATWLFNDVQLFVRTPYRGVCKFLLDKTFFGLRNMDFFNTELDDHYDGEQDSDEYKMKRRLFDDFYQIMRTNV